MDSPKSTPKDVFYHLLAIAALYVSVVSFITLLFQYVNVLFPDQLQFYFEGAMDAIRRATAALLVVWPVYILMSWLLGKDMALEPAKREVKVRKWLVYLTLFIAAITIIVDLVTLIYNFLDGELSARFYLKVLVVLVVAGAVFGYYVWDLRRSANVSSQKPRTIAGAISVAILLTIIAGFFIIGSPALQRARRFDDRRVSDLQTLQNEIINIWMQKDILPAQLNDLKDSISGFVPPVDPETREAYEYIVTGPLSFNLCANFKTDKAVNGSTRYPKAAPYPIGAQYGQNWEHTATRTCFNRVIDPLLYPDRPLRAK